MPSLQAPPHQPAALQILLEASSMLLSATDESAALARILDLSGPLLLADAYAVWRLGRNAHDREQWEITLQRGLSEHYTAQVRLTNILPCGIWAVEDVLGDPRLASGHDLYRSEGIRSMMILPWQLDGATHGTVVFYWRELTRFDPQALGYATTLANLSASALNRQELQEQNLREKHRLAFLAEASAVLASSLDYELTLERVAQLAVPKIAAWCTVHVVEDGQMTRLATVHADPAMRQFTDEYLRQYPEVVSPESGLGKVLCTGEPEVHWRITDEMFVPVARDEKHLSVLQNLHLTSSILMPLVARGKVLGALRLLTAGSGPTFTQEDLHLAEDLARRAAVAIENAQLHRSILDQQSELRLSHAAARMGSWSWDLVRNKLFWSDEFKALHGLPLSMEASYEAGRELVFPDDRERVIEELQAALDGPDEALSMEQRAVTSDGRVLWLQTRGRIQRDANGKAMRLIGLMIDVTESRKAEQALRRTEKLAAAGRLAATVAHEVNNPLEALTNLVYLAQRVEALPAEALDHLQVAEEELNRMAHIVRQTLGFYQETATPRVTDLNRLVSSVASLYRSRAASRGVHLLDETSAIPGAQVRVNAGEIKQIVANLVSNAIDATPREGTVRLTLQHTEQQVQVVVADTGCGISAQNRLRLFEAFFTTKLDVGTGLGLWVSQGIAEKHGGRVVVDEPVEDKPGTTMRLVLPRSMG